MTAYSCFIHPSNAMGVGAGERGGDLDYYAEYTAGLGKCPVNSKDVAEGAQEGREGRHTCIQ